MKCLLQLCKLANIFTCIKLFLYCYFVTFLPNTYDLCIKYIDIAMSMEYGSI